MEFAQYEGKTTYDSFERVLVEQLMISISRKSLSLGTQLLIGLFLSRVDNFSNTFQQKVARKITKLSIAELFIDFEPSSRLHRQLIEICMEKGVFNDDNLYYIKMQLMIYGRKLQELQSEVSKSNSSGKVIQYKFTPEDITSKPVRARMSTFSSSSVPTKRSRKQSKDDSVVEELIALDYLRGSD